MGISLREAMEITPFSRAVLVAGKQGIGKAVYSANIQEVPDVDRWLHGGEILFTSGYAFQSVENGMKLLRVLSEKKASAIAIKPGQYLSEIPEEMISYAESLGFPVFQLPEDLPYMDCILPILERITQNQLFILRRNETIHNQLIQNIVEGKGLKGICAVLSDAIQSPVSIISQQGIVLAENGAQGEQDGCGWCADGGSGRFFTRNTMKKLVKNKCNKISTMSGKEIVCIPVFVKDELIAYLILDMRYEEMAEMDRMAFENASTLTALEILKEKEVLNEERKVKGQLVDDLLANRYEEEEIMIQRGKFVGFDFMKKSSVFVLGIDSFEENQLGKQRISEKRVQRIKNEIQLELERELGSRRNSILLTGRGMDTIGLFQIWNERDEVEYCRILERVIEKLEKQYGQLAFSAGIGRTKTGLRELTDSWKEAEYSVRAGRRLRRVKEKGGVTHFENLGCLCFLSELENSKAAREFYREYMGEIEKYDRENNGSLIETLDTYFSCGNNIRKTAEALFIHKNSVIYRFTKIENILGKKLTDNEIIFNLQLCLKLRMLKRL